MKIAPTIGVAALFESDGAARKAVDDAFISAALDTGFIVIDQLPQWALLSKDAKAALLSIFSLSEESLRPLWLWKFAPENPNVYRGWFALQNGFPTYKDGIDIGQDLVRPERAMHGGDPLCEPTPFPPEHLLPGWRSAAATYYRAMERLSTALVQSLARGLGLDEHIFDEAFLDGNSTLRLTRYPLRSAQSLVAVSDEAMWVDYQGQRRYLTGRPHSDTGCLTLLAQDGVEGLQAQHHDGSWFEIPPTEGTLAVNFGKVLQRWTGGRIKATPHRVLGSARERCSIPFFYEPRPDAVIAPLPGMEPFDPFYYGDHLWETITVHNVEFRGIGDRRKPLGPPPLQKR
jgi:isopenicillin N synthase-like dioxygenase